MDAGVDTTHRLGVEARVGELRGQQSTHQLAAVLRLFHHRQSSLRNAVRRNGVA